MSRVQLPPTVKTGPGILPIFGSSPGIRQDNFFDNCLQEEKNVLDAALCDPGSGLQGNIDAPWTTMPTNGRRLRELGSKSVSAITFDSSNNLVLSFLVPVGYDGLIDTVICNIDVSGSTGFVEGSGVITWRLAANQRYLRDVGNIQFSLGSLAVPVPTQNSGLRVYSGDVVNFYVAISAAGIGVINPASTIVCAVFGWIYPR